MSYSINEGIDDSRRQADNLKVIREHFPDARLDTLPDGRDVWCSPGALARANDVDIVAAKDGTVYVCPRWANGDVRVYAPWGNRPPAWEWLHRIKQRVKVYGAIVVAATTDELPGEES